jgi:hypothetical protein
MRNGALRASSHEPHRCVVNQRSPIANQQRFKDQRSLNQQLAIAACAPEHGAKLWTLNEKDFEDIPGLGLYRG